MLPLAIGGTTAHVLAIDYALRPVLSSLGSAQVVQGYFLLDRDITLAGGPDGRAVLAAEARETLTRTVDRFADALDLHHGAARDLAGTAVRPLSRALTAA